MRDRSRENILRLRFGLDDGKMRTDHGKSSAVTRERIKSDRRQSLPQTPPPKQKQTICVAYGD